MEIKKTEGVSSQKNAFNPARAIVIIIIFMIVVWGIWFAVSKIRSGAGKDVAGIGSNIASSSLPSKNKDEQKPLPPDSFYKNYVKIMKSSGALETYADKETIEIKVMQSNLSAVDISNWKFVNSNGDEAIIGRSTEIPTGGKVNQTAPTYVKGGDTLIVSSGHSPIGISFQTNLCTGYFEQFQDFIPPLMLRCPQPTSLESFRTLERDCQNFIRTIPQCTTNTKPFPAGTSAGCKAFVMSAASYNGCVTENRGKIQFTLPEWRIYLGRDKELWAQPKDTVILLDSDGKLIDSVKYGK